MRRFIAAACLLLALAYPAGALVEEDHSAATQDGWRLALHRYRPETPRFAEPVLLLHGFIENRRIWDLDAETSLARRLSEIGFDVWTLELRGSGDSEKLSPEATQGWNFSIDDFTRYDGPAGLNAVLAQTKAKKILLVGHSLGGLVVYSLLEGPLAPRIKGAVTLAGAGTMSGGTAFEQAIRRFFGLLGLTLAPVLPPGTPFPAGFVLHKTLGGNDGAWAELAKRLCSPLGQPFWNEGNMTPGRVEALLRRAVTDTSMNVVKNFLDYVRQGTVPGVTDKLFTIRAPVLALAGENDLVIPPSDVRKIAGLCRADYVEIGGAGHEDLCVGVNAPTAVYPVVARWLSSRATPLKPLRLDLAPAERQLEILRAPAWR